MKTLTLLKPPINARRLLLGGLLSSALALAGSAHAQTAPAEPDVVVPPDLVALESTEPAEAAARISATFETLAGSEENASNLVAGLRSGSEINLITEVDGQTVQRSFQPATGEQGYGNIFVALSLAEQELAKAGVTEPTAAQLEAALNGGVITVGTGDTVTTVELAGVLSLRAEGQGWGQIARQLDMNVGKAVSSMRRDARATERLMARPEKASAAARPATAERVQLIERVAPPTRVERPVRVERVERPVRPERPGRP